MKNRVLGAILCALMLLTLLPVTALAEETEKVYVELTEENFPDANFREYLQDVYERQINNNRISVSTVSTIHCNRKGIKDLTGIQLFTELQILNCEDNQLTKVNFSNNKKLRILDCAGNQLTELDVTENTALTHLTCTDNYLTELDVSKNTALDHLFCNENRLTSLDVSANQALKELYCSDNQLTGLDVTANTALTRLYCYKNKLTELDISKDTALEDLWCDDNALTELDVSMNTKLVRLEFGNNLVEELDVSQNTALEKLECYANQLTALDVSANTALTKLDCGSNKLTELDVSQNAELTELDCYYNQLSTLDVSANTALTKLNCVKNKLTTLDVSHNTELTELNCAGNQLTKVDTSQCPNLTELDCTAMTTGALTVDVADRSKLLLSTLGVDAGSVTVQVKGVVQNGVTFGGRMGSYRSTEFWLYAGEEIPADDATPLCGTFLYTRDGTYRFDTAPVTDGTYTLKVKERGSDAEYYTITVAGGVVSGQPNKEEDGPSGEIEVGDLNGSGGVADINDVQCLYTYLASGEILGEFKEEPTLFKELADVNNDKNVDVYDLQYLYEQVAGLR